MKGVAAVADLAGGPGAVDPEAGLAAEASVAGAAAVVASVAADVAARVGAGWTARRWSAA